MVLLISLIIAAIIVQFAGDKLEEPVRTLLYRLKGEPVLSYSTDHVDSNGVPYVDYHELRGYTAGKQYNATIVCNYAIDYHKNYLRNKDEDAYRKFFNCVQWLQKDITYKENSALFIFRWKQPWYDSVCVPFTSGMTSGLAIQVFTNAYQLTKDSSYLQRCKKLMNGYFIPIEQGGFTYKTASGWWYEELADTARHTPFILDGHIFAITGLYPYWQLTKNDSARIAIDNGIKGLKNSLPNYDIGNGTMYYDKYKKLADKNYHKLLTQQMKQLYDLTGDKVFLQYHEKWKAPLDKPYLLRIVQQRNVSGLVLFVLMTFALFVVLVAVSKLLRLRHNRAQPQHL
jgi:hypothetical protein